ncbi:MAG: 3',5'-cyclic-nucleotide phosphodiesterase [Chitinophagaceae bacterium]
MKHCNKAILLFLFCLSYFTVFTQKRAAGLSFKVVPLGVKGGSDESNLSAYMLAAAGSNDYVCMDAGTVHYGIQKAISAGIFRGPVQTVLKNNIKGYLISHPHLDHVAGLIINSPDDTTKNIYALPFCTDVLKEKYFSWKSWANFADDGEKPLLNKYHYRVLAPGHEIPVANTTLAVTAYELSHSNPFKSTAFLVRSGDAYLLYLGDTGADSSEHANNLLLLWQRIAPLLKEKKLKALFIEVSFDNAQPENLLFGHLTPALLMREMNILSSLAGEAAMHQLPVIITHEKFGGIRESLIKKQLFALNAVGVKLIFPVQAKQLSF